MAGEVDYTLEQVKDLLEPRPRCEIGGCPHWVWVEMPRKDLSILPPKRLSKKCYFHHHNLPLLEKR